MPDETTIYLAQSRTFQISPVSGEVIETELYNHFAPVDNLTGTTVDVKYKILALLGSGGMGAVYRARHLMLDKDLALKTIRSTGVSTQAFERFTREVRAVAKLDHPNIVRVFDSGISEANQPYYTMELLLGQSLQERLESSGALPLTDALAIFSQVAEGLKSAHNHGIVHRDLKPANIFLSTLAPSSPTLSGSTSSTLSSLKKVGPVKIVDFGIAKLVDNSASTQSLTTVGTIFGSPLYMSPEQSRGDEVDQRSDIYSFGCAFYEALTGQPPLIGQHALETMMLHQTVAPPRLSKRLPNREFVPLLESLVGKLLHKHPEQRPQSFDEVLESFQRIQKLTEINTETLAALPGSAAASQDTPVEAGAEQSWKKPLIIGASVFLITGAITTGLIILQAQPKSSPATKRLDPLITNSALTGVKQESKYQAPQSSLRNPIGTDGENDSFALLSEPTKTIVLPSVNIKIEKDAREYTKILAALTPANFDVISKSSITKLDLRRCTFDNDQLKKLSKLKLEVLCLAITHFDDFGAAALSNCTDLTTLEADGTDITDTGCLPLSKLPALVKLDLCRTAITDAGLTALAKSSHLAELKIDNTVVTISGVTKLCERSTNLRFLSIAFCRKLTAEQVRTLRSQFPQIQIRSDDNKVKANGFGSYLN